MNLDSLNAFSVTVALQSVLWKYNQKQPNNQNQNTRKTEHTKRINANNRHSTRDNCLHVHAYQNPDMQEHEKVDLTCSPQPKQTINQSSLLVCGTELKNIRVNELKRSLP